MPCWTMITKSLRSMWARRLSRILWPSHVWTGLTWIQSWPAKQRTVTLASPSQQLWSWIWVVSNLLFAASYLELGLHGLSYVEHLRHSLEREKERERGILSVQQIHSHWSHVFSIICKVREKEREEGINLANYLNKYSETNTQLCTNDTLYSTVSRPAWNCCVRVERTDWAVESGD